MVPRRMSTWRATRRCWPPSSPARCRLLAPGGEVHVALKTGPPYDAWNPVGCAHHATGGSLQLKTSAAFDPDAFPGVCVECIAI